MTDQPALEIELEALDRKAVVADLVYAPLETPLLAAARRRGNPAVEGLGMLLHQAVPGFTHWGGRVPEVDDALRAAVLEG
jgi:shikimate dehydrogenase